MSDNNKKQKVVETKNQGALYLGDEIPNFIAESTQGRINFHEFIDNSWALLCSHPADFTPVCTTELGTLSKLKDEWTSRGVKVLALSCDPVAKHNEWVKDIIDITGAKDVYYPIVEDPLRQIACKFGMLDQTHLDAKGIPLTVRSVFIIGPDKKIKLTLTYPAATGRNFNEIVRVIDSLQLAVSHKVATPADWKVGDDTVVLPSVSTEDAKNMFSSVNEIRPWLRTVPDPSKK